MENQTPSVPVIETVATAVVNSEPIVVKCEEVGKFTLLGSMMANTRNTEDCGHFNIYFRSCTKGVDLIEEIKAVEDKFQNITLSLMYNGERAFWK